MSVPTVLPYNSNEEWLNGQKDLLKKKLEMSRQRLGVSSLSPYKPTEPANLAEYREKLKQKMGQHQKSGHEPIGVGSAEYREKLKEKIEQAKQRLEQHDTTSFDDPKSPARQAHTRSFLVSSFCPPKMETFTPSVQRSPEQEKSPFKSVVEQEKNLPSPAITPSIKEESENMQIFEEIKKETNEQLAQCNKTIEQIYQNLDKKEISFNPSPSTPTIETRSSHRKIEGLTFSAFLHGISRLIQQIWSAIAALIKKIQ